MSPGQVRIKSNGLSQLKLLLAPVPAFTQCKGEIVFELWVTGIEFESLAVGANCPRGVPLLHCGNSLSVKSSRGFLVAVLSFEFQEFLELLLGSRAIIQTTEDFGEFMVSL